MPRTAVVDINLEADVVVPEHICSTCEDADLVALYRRGWVKLNWLVPSGSYCICVCAAITGRVVVIPDVVGIVHVIQPVPGRIDSSNFYH